MFDVLLVNITWNPSGWRNIYINPRAGHSYAREHPGHESLNFKFDKKGIDTKDNIYGFVQWENKPKQFKENGLIIFYTRNTKLNKGEIVGIYGKANVLETMINFRVKGFQRNRFNVNLKASKDFSLLFPIPLVADHFKSESGTRMVGQIGFTYKDLKFAEKIISAELTALSNSGGLAIEYKKLISIYEHYLGKNYETNFVDKDEMEQESLERILKPILSKLDIIKELNNLKNFDSELVQVRNKQYKRDNKTIVQIKILRDFKCQLCGNSILKKNGSRYIEAAHIQPKKQKGCETPENILILCPNHHKEFDLGKLKIVKHNKSFIDFKLNDRRFKVDLSIQ